MTGSNQSRFLFLRHRHTSCNTPSGLPFLRNLARVCRKPRGARGRLDVNIDRAHPFANCNRCSRASRSAGTSVGCWHLSAATRAKSDLQEGRASLNRSQQLFVLSAQKAPTRDNSHGRPRPRDLTAVVSSSSVPRLRFISIELETSLRRNERDTLCN